MTKQNATSCWGGKWEKIARNCTTENIIYQPAELHSGRVLLRGMWHIRIARSAFTFSPHSPRLRIASKWDTSAASSIERGK